MSLFYIASFVVPFLLGMFLIPQIRKYALKWDFVDVPSARKIHSAPIPLGGGLIVFVGFLTVFVVFTSFLHLGDMKSAVGIVAGAVLIFMIGIYDDAYEMGVLPKMLGQIMAAIIFLAFVEKIPPVMSLPVYFAFGIFWMVGIQNAMNFLDNMDGLCAGVSMSIAIGLGMLFVFKDMPIFAIMSFALAGGALGFLRFNLPPASIFLGDTGSLIFGFSLSCLAIVHLNTSKSLAGALSPLLIMAYPICDLTVVTVSRLNDGRKVYIGGKDHSSHKINFMGLSRRATVFTIHAINTALMLFGIALFFMSDSPYQTLAIVILAFILAFTGAHLYKNILYLRYKIFSLLLDIVAVNLTFALYIAVRYFSGLFLSGSLAIFTEMVVPLAWINIFWLLMYSASGLYDIPFELKFKRHMLALIRPIALGVLAFALVTYKPGVGFQVSMASLGVFALTQFIINSMMRYMYYRWHGIRTNYPERRPEAIIVKLHPGEICDQDLVRFAMHYSIKGYVGDPDEVKARYLGPTEKLGDILRDNRVARVILDLPENQYGELLSVFNSAFFMDTRFLVKKADYDNLRGLKRYPTRFGDLCVITFSLKKIFPRLVKRLCDFFLSAVFLLPAAPWMAIKLLYARIKKVNFLESTPIFGRGGKACEILCPRGADGRLHYRTPWALFAVLRGDLSLVGTTISIGGNKGEEEMLPGKWRKYLTKPGLLGPGYYGKTEREKFDLDLDYIERASIFFDFRVGLRQMLKF